MVYLLCTHTHHPPSYFHRPHLAPQARILSQDQLEQIKYRVPSNGSMSVAVCVFSFSFSTGSVEIIISYRVHCYSIYPMITSNSVMRRVCLNVLRQTRDISLRIILLFVSACVTLIIIYAAILFRDINRGSLRYNSKALTLHVKVVCIVIGTLFSAGFLLWILAHLRRWLHNRRGGSNNLRSMRSTTSRFHLALMQRDFTADDYEILQQLDEGIVRANEGASERELRRLPLCRMTASDLAGGPAAGKSCAICLANFKLNEDIKSLPCLHRYHQNCIDKWLRHKAICPVCKFPAVGFDTSDDMV